MTSDRFVAVLSVDHIPLLRQRFGAAAIDQILFSYSQHMGQHLPDRYVLARWDSSTFVITPREGGTEAQREVARAVGVPDALPPASSRPLGLAPRQRHHAHSSIPKGEPLTEQIDAIANAIR